MMEMLKQGQPVRLTIDLDNGRLPAGATGYLNKGSWAGAEWGVVFDLEADQDMKTTHVQLETADGTRVRLVDVVELIYDETDSDWPTCWACGAIVNTELDMCSVCGACADPDVDCEADSIDEP